MRPVSWVVVQKDFHDLVVSTYGRGFYILDDITPLEQQAKAKSDATAVLSEPRAVYRFMRGGQALHGLFAQDRAEGASRTRDPHSRWASRYANCVSARKPA